MIKLKSLLESHETQAILTSDPVKLYFVKNYEGRHIDILQRLFPNEIEKLTRYYEDMGYNDDDDSSLFMAGNHLAKQHNIARIIIENDILYFNTYQDTLLTSEQISTLKDYCIRKGLRLIQTLSRGFAGKYEKEFDLSENKINEGVYLDSIIQQIKKLESEWETLDSQGTGHARQMEIQRELQKLWMEKEKWENLHSAVNEAWKYPAVILGAITQNQDILAVPGDDPGGSKHPREWARYKHWRYVPDMEMLGWWESPTPDEEMIVKDYLKGEGYPVNIHYIYGYQKENKELVMEGLKETTALEYLKKLVQGGEFRGRVFLAGGAVRDLVRGDTPKDFDVVVTGDINAGMNFAKWATQTMGNYSSTGNPTLFPTFGTAKFTLRGINYNGVDLSDVDIESVATRKEKYTHGSRKPEVTTGELKDDVYRRDYTVNSLLMDLTTGEILDLTGKGKQDIQLGIIRTTSDPDIIYKDDSLRILRGVRFAIKYGWEIDKDTLEGMKRNVHELQNISKERIQGEINKMLLTTSPAKAIHILKDIGALKYVIPELEQTIGMGQNKWHSDDVFMHTMNVLSKTKPTLIARIGGLLHDIGKVATKQVIDGEIHFYSHENLGADTARKILTNLKYPNDIIEPVVLAIKNHMRLKQAGMEGEKISDKALRKFVVDMGEHLEDVMDIIHSDNISHSPEASMPNQIPNLLKRIEQLKNTIPTKNQKLPVTGEDLKLLGLSPGPLFKELLDLVRDKQLETPGATKDEYLEMIKNYLKNELR